MTTTPHGQVPEALEDFEVRKLAAIGAVSTSSGLVERRPIEYRRELENQFVRGFRAAEKRFAALRAQQPAPATQQAGEVSESIEQLAVARYKVVPAHESMFHCWAVVAGDGAQQLYLGREVECENMARKFAGAFLDGAFVAMQNAAPQPSPTAQAARAPEDSVTAPAAVVIECGNLYAIRKLKEDTQ